MSSRTGVPKIPPQGTTQGMDFVVTHPGVLDIPPRRSREGFMQPGRCPGRQPGISSHTASDPEGNAWTRFAGRSFLDLHGAEMHDRPHVGSSPKRRSTPPPSARGIHMHSACRGDAPSGVLQPEASIEWRNDLLPVHGGCTVYAFSHPLP